MSYSLNLSEIIKCVKNIVDSVRCTVCDKAEGARVRHPCGHTTCDGCLTAAQGCMLCLTPPSTLTKPVADVPFTQRAVNACSLLSNCEDTFSLDVCRRARISEQLKAERELFPECIQAPLKYFNKRKSLASLSNKENWRSLVYPGEDISRLDSFKMNQCNNYVQQWLNENGTQPRKAFSDLNVNPQHNKKKMKQNNNKDQKENFNRNKKRPLSNSSYSLLSTNITTNLNIKKFKKNDFDIFQDNDPKKVSKNENDESGIVLDDEPILIEDSQSQVLDKDALAILAVEAADNKQDLTRNTLKNTLNDEYLPPVHKHVCVVNNNNKNVPFLKKSSLWDCCFYCKKNCTESENDSKNISITIENNSFITTIKITNSTERQYSKQSMQVQTDATEDPVINKTSITQETLQPETKIIENDMLTQDLFKKNKPYQNGKQEQIVKERVTMSPNMFELCEDVPNKKRCIVIDDSDSDVSSLEVSCLQVTAEVHRSCEPLDYGILTERNTTEVLNRPRNKLRGATPDSNNSSDKENCDPNKKRKHRISKKNKYPKK